MPEYRPIPTSYSGVGMTSAYWTNAIWDMHRNVLRAEHDLTTTIMHAIDAGITYQQCADALGISRATLHRRYVTGRRAQQAHEHLPMTQESLPGADDWPISGPCP